MAIRPPGSAILAQQHGLGNRATDTVKNQSPIPDMKPLFARELSRQHWPACSRFWRGSIYQNPHVADVESVVLLPIPSFLPPPLPTELSWTQLILWVPRLVGYIFLIRKQTRTTCSKRHVQLKQLIVRLRRQEHIYTSCGESFSSATSDSVMQQSDSEYPHLWGFGVLSWFLTYLCFQAVVFQLPALTRLPVFASPISTSGLNMPNSFNKTGSMLVSHIHFKLAFWFCQLLHKTSFAK